MIYYASSRKPKTNSEMKHNRIKQLLAAAMICGPVMAIEPPVEAEPIPPQAPPVVEEGEPQIADEPAAPVPMPQAGKPYMGVVLDPLPELLAGHLKLADGEGLLIADLAPGGPAAAAGLRANDVLVAIDGQVVGSVEAVRGITETRKVGDKVTATVIQDGEHRELEITLGAMPDAPDMRGGLQGQAGQMELPEALLGQLPEKHADAFRQAMEENMRALERLENNPGMQEDVMRRLREMMGNQGGGMNLDAGFQSTVRLMDDQGSVELRSSDKGREAAVFDKEGNVVWEGPYETDQDKAAVPDDVRARLEKLNVGIIEEGGVNGGAFRFQIGPGAFRQLDDVAPEAPVEPEAPEAPEAPPAEGE